MRDPNPRGAAARIRADYTRRALDAWQQVARPAAREALDAKDAHRARRHVRVAVAAIRAAARRVLALPPVRGATGSYPTPREVGRIVLHGLSERAALSPGASIGAIEAALEEATRAAAALRGILETWVEMEARHDQGETTPL
jgi:acetoin utilization deacetylase AcuC-like enzyme